MKNNITAKVSITLNASASKVWDHLTKPDLIKEYFFGTDTKTNWEVGSPLIFEGEWEGKKYQDKGTILKNVQYKTIQYNYWSSMSGIEDKPENYVVVTYELDENEGTTLLTITQDNVPTEQMKEHSEENWMKVLRSLKNIVETTDTFKI